MLPLIVETMSIVELIFVAIVMILALDVTIEFPNPPAMIIWVIAFILLVFSAVFDTPIEWFYLSMILDAIVIAMGLAVRSAEGRL